MPLLPSSSKFTSPIFKGPKRTAIVSNTLTRIAKRFKKLTVDTMVFSQPQGRDYAKGRGQGFRRVHRASRRGQPPAPDTMNLVRSVEDNKVNPSTHEVYVDGNQAPYGEYLERPRLMRPIMGRALVKGFEDSQMQEEVRRMERELMEDR